MREKRGREKGEEGEGGGRRGVGGGRGEAKREGGEKRKNLRARSARRSRREEGDKGAGGGGKGAGGGEAFPLSAPSSVWAGGSVTIQQNVSTSRTISEESSETYSITASDHS